MKKILSVFLSIVIVLSLIPVSVFAATDTYLETTITASVSYKNNGESQDALLTQIGTYQGRTGSKKKGYTYTTGKIWLASLPENSQITSISFKKTDVTQPN